MEGRISTFVFCVDFVFIQVKYPLEKGWFVFEDRVVEKVVACVLVLLSDGEQVLLTYSF